MARKRYLIVAMDLGESAPGTVFKTLAKSMIFKMLMYSWTLEPIYQMTFSFPAKSSRTSL